MIFMSGKPILGILLGDAAGVGPEIIVKLAASRFYDEYCRPVVIGDVRVFERGARICGLEIPVQVVNKVEEADWTKGMPVWTKGTWTLSRFRLQTSALKAGAPA